MFRFIWPFFSLSNSFFFFFSYNGFLYLWGDLLGSPTHKNFYGVHCENRQTGDIAGEYNLVGELRVPNTNDSVWERLEEGLGGEQRE